SWENAKPLEPAIKWEAFPDQGHSIVSFCSWDRQQLLARIAGSFSVVPINILSADTYARGDNLVLDVFRVCNTESRAVTNTDQRTRAEKTLARALTGETFDFDPLIREARRRSRDLSNQEIPFPTRIRVDNKLHPGYTLIQIEAPDRLGLLYDLLSCIDRESVHIALSRISTEKGAAIDTFYVVDPSTRNKITDAHRITSLQKALQLAALLHDQ